MRFHTLAISGFGPFAGEEAIDFDRLGSSGLFLLSGPTGAGKTTILDALCYALFGETTGEGQAKGSIDGRSGAELRCTRSTADQKTKVDLAFSVGGRTYRVERNPEYERAALRGGGITREAAKAVLYRRTDAAAETPGEWEPIATKVRDVNERVHDVTGFTADQFRRVVVIPQGRFRDVLVSSGEAREELLKRIFGTNSYERFESIVSGRRTAAQSAHDAVRREREVLLQGHDWAAGMDDASVAAALLERTQAATDAAAAMAARLGDVAQQHTAATEALGQAREIERLARALKAAQDRDRRAKEEVARRAPDRATLEAAIEAREPARLLHEWRTLAGQHAAAVAAERERAEAAAAAAAIVTGRTTTRDQAEQAHARTTEIGQRLGEIAANLADAETVRERFDVAQKAVTTAEGREGTASKVSGVAAAAACAAADRLQEADANLADASGRYVAGTAARLAAGLTDHAACPVCGSMEHPRPAEPAEHAPTEAALEELRNRQAAARTASDEATKAAAAEQAALAAAEAATKAARATLAATPQPPDVTALVGEKLALEKTRADLDATLRNARTALDKALAVAKQEDEKLAGARAAAGLFGEKATAARGLFDTALAASRFVTADDLAAAERDGGVIESLTAALAAADREVTAAADAVTAAVAAVDGRPEPDIAVVEATQRQLAEALEQVRKDDELARTQLQEARGLGHAHGNLAERSAAADGAFQTAQRLHQIVSGMAHAEDKVSLHRWVLGAVLEEVVAEATVMLRDMTRGRYELVRAESAGDKKSLAGLDIDVLDAWNGTRRPARTLSGGETFLASLALSLALARTAERHQGGRRLETVFIDEGFGSLDAETLEYAMATLASLRDEGRVVGVISHVDEMQRAIPAQLRIIRRGEAVHTEIVGI
jgi:exonuclease SbcC